LRVPLRSSPSKLLMLSIRRICHFGNPIAMIIADLS
jgi:hypothetical protein